MKKLYAIDVNALARYPLALQRRLVRAAADLLAIELDADHVEAVLDVARGQTKACELPGGWRLERGFREMRFVPGKSASRVSYQYSLRIPGEVTVPEIGSVVRARMEPLEAGTERDTLVPHSLTLTGRDLTVRNWRPGDRFHPEHSGVERNVKELLDAMRVSGTERKLWPVVTESDRIVWVRGARPQHVLLLDGNTIARVTIECMEPAIG